VLAIGGVGGLAVGLAGREILENLFTGLIILSSNPFEVRASECDVQAP
jgi:MscS family membrane protein